MEDNLEFINSINKLSSKLDQFSNALNNASESVKIEEGSTHNKIIDLLDQVIDQNEKIARGMVEILEHLRRQPRPQPIPPMPMYQQPRMQPRQQPMPQRLPSQQMMPQQPPLQRTMSDTNLPPPPPAPMLGNRDKFKKSLDFFK